MSTFRIQVEALVSTDPEAIPETDGCWFRIKDGKGEAEVLVGAKMAKACMQSLRKGMAVRVRGLWSAPAVIHAQSVETFPREDVGE